MSIKERWDRQRQRDGEHVEHMADQVMRDTRWDRVRDLQTRRRLVVLLAVLVLAMVPACAVGGAVLGVLPVVAATALWLVLRMAVRVVTDLPLQYLDERQRDRRNRAYGFAYQAFTGTTLLVAMSFFVWSLAVAPADVVLRLDMDLVIGCYFAITAMALALPTAFMAWTEQQV